MARQAQSTATTPSSKPPDSPGLGGPSASRGAVPFLDVATPVIRDRARERRERADAATEKILGLLDIDPDFDRRVRRAVKRVILDEIDHERDECGDSIEGVMDAHLALRARYAERLQDLHDQLVEECEHCDALVKTIGEVERERDAWRLFAETELSS